MSDLVEVLTAAALEAIAAEAPDLRRDPERIRGVTLELHLDGRGRIDEGCCFVERRVNVGRLLGDRGPKV